jgi:hypothetical protein
LPATVIVPGVPLEPGAKVPPLMMLVAPTVPLPPSVAPPLTVVRLDEARAGINGCRTAVSRMSWTTRSVLFADRWFDAQHPSSEVNQAQ